MGFADGHTVSTYHILNLKTGKTCLTKDMSFLGNSCGEWNKMQKLALVPMSNEGSDDEEIETLLGNNENKNNSDPMVEILP